MKVSGENEKLSILALLSQGHAKPLVFGPKEEGIQPRRRERRLRGDDGETIAVELWEKIGPTEKMDNLRKEIEKARLRVARIYERLLAKSEPPTMQNLTKFRQLVSEAEFLANQYQDLELATRRAHEARREEMSRALARHEDRQVSGLKVPLETFRADLKKAQKNQNGYHHQPPSWLEQSNRIWLARIAVRGPEGAADALAEGEISPEEFRALKLRFALPIKSHKEPVFHVRHKSVAQPKSNSEKKDKKKKKGDQGGQ